MSDQSAVFDAVQEQLAWQREVYIDLHENPELSMHETCLASFSVGLSCCPLTVFGTILDHPDKGWSSSLYYGFEELLTCIDHIV